ncbi:MAG TPA: hypothetical protein VE170_14370 [Candidatus Limnocylindria bacterium]|nr:hypothetical protein [Candidatus Limnocylindria bacterium]
MEHGKLRHIAFISQLPKVQSDFYQKYFRFEECKVFPSGARMVIDRFLISPSCSKQQSAAVSGRIEPTISYFLSAAAHGT